ncbi:MAG: AAA-like domain-containing protein [Coleofasciculaceae cyanobacterium]
MQEENRLSNLNEQEKQSFMILAEYLIKQGGKARVSYAKLADLCNMSPAHAGRFFKEFEKQGLIEVEAQKGRAGNLVTLKYYVYQGSLITGRMPRRCPLYVRRKADVICEQVLRSGQSVQASLPFIRIKAARGMGKSSLLIQLWDFLETEQKHKIAFVDLNSNSFCLDLFKDLDQLLYVFTEEIVKAFKDTSNTVNPPELSLLWSKHKYRSPGSKCTMYLQEYVFSKIKGQKTLLIDGIDQVLGKNAVQTEFLNLLRTWYEEKMKNVSNSKLVWPNIVIAYSTEPYLDNDVHVSPLTNVGTPVDLGEFSSQEILNLAKRYGLNGFSLQEVNLLEDLIGGHPTLINRTLYEVSKRDISLAELESQATQLDGPFADYLLEYLELLLKNDELAECLKKIMRQETVQNEFAVFQLLKAGLIKLDQQGQNIYCELYRRYLTQHL